MLLTVQNAKLNWSAFSHDFSFGDLKPIEPLMNKHKISIISIEIQKSIIIPHLISLWKNFSFSAKDNYSLP